MGDDFGGQRGRLSATPRTPRRFDPPGPDVVGESVRRGVRHSGSRHSRAIISRTYGAGRFGQCGPPRFRPVGRRARWGHGTRRLRRLPSDARRSTRLRRGAQRRRRRGGRSAGGVDRRQRGRDPRRALAEEEPDVTPDDIDPRDADDPPTGKRSPNPTTRSTASTRRSTAANAGRSTGRPRTATPSTTSSSNAAPSPSARRR